MSPNQSANIATWSSDQILGLFIVIDRQNSNCSRSSNWLHVVQYTVEVPICLHWLLMVKIAFSIKWNELLKSYLIFTKWKRKYFIFLFYFITLLSGILRKIICCYYSNLYFVGNIRFLYVYYLSIKIKLAWNHLNQVWRIHELSITHFLHKC